MTPEQQTQWLVDRAQITDTLHEWLHCVDAKLLSRQLALFTENGVMESTWGSFTIPQLHAMFDSAEMKAHGGFTATHHILSNHTVEIDGDTARATAKVQAVHVRDPADSNTWWTLGGVYDNELRRTDDGWKLSHVRLLPVWETGDSGLSHRPLS